MINSLVNKLKSNKKYFFMFIVLIGLLSITIGSALISSSLSLTSNTKISKNSWIIYFDNINVASDSSETENGAHIVDREKTQIDFEANLRNRNDFYEFTVDVVNDGTIDAQIESVTKTELTPEQQEYLEFYVEYIDVDVNEAAADPTLKEIKRCDYLYSGHRRKIVAYVKYKDVDLDKYPQENIRLNLSFSIKYVQDDLTCTKGDDPTECILKIRPNGGIYEGRLEPRDIYLDEGSSYNVSIPTLKYHNFEGWEFDKTTNPEDGPYTFDENVFTMDHCDVITMTAQWREGDYVARIMNTYYPTIQEAFDAASGVWEDNTVWLIKDTTESPINTTRKRFTFNLDGHTVTGKITTNPGTDITLLNGGVESVIESEPAFYNLGKLTIGENDGYVDVDNSIALVGMNSGLENVEGSEFYFYDGFIEGITGITGDYNYTGIAPNHFVFSDYIAANKHQKLYLARNPNRAVAKIDTGGTIYYYDLPGAIQKAEGSKKTHTAATDDQYVIKVIRDFEAAYDLEVHANKRIVIEMEDFDVTVGKEFTNNGYLKINNNKTSMDSLKPSKTIVNNGTLDINNVRVAVTTNTTAIQNKGTLNLTNVRVQGNSSYGVSNEGSGVINMDADTVLIASGSYGLNNTSNNLVLTTGTVYGLNNSATIEIKDDIVVHKNGDIPAINNNSSGNLTITDGTIDSVTNSATIKHNGGNIESVYNTGNYTQNGGEVNPNSTARAIYNDGTYTINDGSIKGQGNLFDSRYSYSGTLNINGGLLETVSGCAIYQGTTNMNDGIIHVINGTVSSNSSTTFNMNGGLVYTESGTALSNHTVNIRGGEIRATDYVSNSYNFTMSGGTANSTGNGITYSNSGTVSGGTVNARLTGINAGSTLNMSNGNVNSSEGTGVVVNGTGTITGGNVTASIYGVHNKGTLTIGSNDGTISSTIPMFQGDSYGLYIEDGHTQNFYDGILKGQVDGYRGNVTGTPLGATIGESTETINEMEYQIDYIVNYENWLRIGENEYNSIDAASDACPENDTCLIEVIKSPEITFVQTFKDANNNKNITFDLRGHTIHSTQVINNRSTVTIIDSSTEKTGKFEVTRSILLMNWNKLTIDDGKYISANDTMVISNRNGASLIINNGTFRGNYSAIENRSSIRINNGTFEGNSGIKNYIREDNYNYSGSITMYDGTISASNNGIETGSLTMYGGRITSSGVGVNGYAKVHDGTIISNGEGISNGATINGGLVHSRDGVAINGSSITVNGGEVISDNNYGLYANSTITVNGGRVTGTTGVTHRYWCDVWGDCWYEPINITGGEIIGTVDHGVAGRGSSVTVTGGLLKGNVDGLNVIYDTRASNPTNVRVGNNEGNISITVPELRGRRYGLYTAAPNMAFFDGIMEGINKAHEGLITLIPDSTMIQDDYKYINREEYQTQYLGNFGDWLRVRDREFSSLYDAYNYANEEDTIYVIHDAYVGFEQSLAQGKKITLDLQGHAVTTTQTLSLQGEKIIKDSVGNGTIQNVRVTAVSSSGNLTLESGSLITSSGNGLSVSGTFTMNGGYVKGTTGITTSATTKIYGGEIIGTNLGMSNSGNLEMHDGYLEGQSSESLSTSNTTLIAGGEIFNSHTTAVNTAKCTTTVTGGKITSTAGVAINQSPGYYDSGNLVISGGDITGKTNGINITGYRSHITTTGGTIIGQNGIGLYESGTTDAWMRINGGEFIGGQYGVYTSTNTHLGENDNRIAIDYPMIRGDLYGLYINGGTLNFYDGILKGITSQVYGQITNIPDLAQEYNSDEMIDEVKYLTRYLITEQVIAINLNQFDEYGNNVQYSNFQRALDEGQEGDTIQLIEDVPLYYVVRNTNTNGFTLDLNGHTITTNKAISSAGRLTIINTDDTKDGIIKTSSSIVLLTNTNELTLDNIKLINNSSSNYVLSSSGTLVANNISVNSLSGITCSGNSTINNSTIVASQTAINNGGRLTINGGTYQGGNYSIYTNTSQQANINDVILNGNFYTASGKTTVDTMTINANFTAASGNVEVINGTFNLYPDYQYNRTISNSANTVIKDSTVSGNGYITNSNSLTFERTTIDIYYSERNCYRYTSYYGMRNSGTLDLNNTTYLYDKNANTCPYGLVGIYNTHDVLIHEGSNVVIGSTSRTQQSYYGILSEGSGKTIIRDENILDDENPVFTTQFTTKGGNVAYALYTNASGATIQVESGKVSAIQSPQTYVGYANYGKIITGIEEPEGTDPVVSQKNPYLYSVGSTRGIAIKKTNGEFHFYDGVLWGSRYAKPETTTKVQRLYEATTYVDNDTGYEYAWLEYMGDDYQGQTVAYLNGIYYTTLQDAINAFDDQPAGEVIKLLKSITEDVHVDLNHNAIINLNGHSITGKVINNGNLQVYDGSIQNFEEEAVINSGKLTIGKNDGTVSSTSVRIVSEVLAIDNYGDVYFYDGYLEGNPTIETDFKEIAEFARIYIVNESQYQRKYLQSLSEESIRNKETDLMLTIDSNNGEYYVGLDMHGEEVWSGDTKILWLKYEDEYQLIEPRKHACYFKGWEATDEVVDENQKVTMGLRDVVVTAKWEVSELAVAKIGDNYYFTIEEALEASKAKDTIELIKDVQEDVTVPNGKEVTIDMKGFIIQGSFVNEGILTLLDGIVENLDGIGLVNNKTLTLGVNDGEIEIAKVQIIGTDVGLQQNGNFNFYDGYIEGDVAMNGTTNSVPRGYFLYTEHNNIKDCQRTYLIGNPENAVAIITDGTTQYFFNLQDAIEAAKLTDKDIYIVKDFEAAYPVEVKEGYDITINMNSYNITTGQTITNNGTLRIYDDSENIGSINSARTIVNTGNLTIEDIQLKQNKSVDTLNNTGNLLVKNATINATDHSAIVSSGTLTIEDATVKTNTGYAINNTGTLNIEGDNEVTTSDLYGIISTGTMTEEISSGTFTGIHTKSNLIINDGVTINGNKAGIVLSGSNQTLIVNGGLITGASNDNAIYNSGPSTVTINGGTISANTGLYCAGGTSNYIVNGGTITGSSIGARMQADRCNLTVNGATITGSSYGIYTYGYYNELNLNGTIKATSGIGVRDERDKNSTDTYYSKINVTGGLIQGATHGMQVRYSSVVVSNAEIKTTAGTRDYYAYYSDCWNTLQLDDGAFINAPRASGIRSESSIIMNDGSKIYSGNGYGYGIRGHYTNLTINGGEIETIGSSSYGILCNDNYLTIIKMKGGSIKSNYIAIGLQDTNANYDRVFDITGGNIEGGIYGLYITSDYTVNIGHLEDELTNTQPVITGGLYGIYTTANSLKFYNGKLRGGAYGYNKYFNRIRPSMYIYEGYEFDEENRKIATLSTTSVSSSPVSNNAKSGNGYARLTYLEEEDDACLYGQVWNFDYTGGEQIFETLCEGNYKLETWGASGGTINSTYIGGYGGYSTGVVNLSQDEVLYINVGGAGSKCNGVNCTVNGGYNGGGSGKGNPDCGSSVQAGSGGGATHIATKSGVLSTLGDNRNSVLIVAGGGGGSNYCNSWNYASGGSGGGYVGGSSINHGAPDWVANGGTQAAGGTQTTGYAFGTALVSNSINIGAGGGWYGGISSGINGSGGGSGYIGNDRITDGLMYSYNSATAPVSMIINYLLEQEAFLQVGDNTYNTFDAASAAIPENGEGTIIVLKDAYIQDIATIVGNRTVTLELNGHLIETDKRITNNSVLTIIDSSDEKTGEIKSYYDDTIQNNSTLTVNGVKITDASNGYSAIYGYSGTGEINVINTTIVSGGNGVYCDSAQHITITNSNITANNVGIYMNKTGSVITYDSGSITAKEHGIYFRNATNSSLTYTTGTIKADMHGICFDNSGTSNLLYYDGTITAKDVGIYFVNSGSSRLTYEDGTITADNVGIYFNGSGSAIMNYKKGNITSENIGVDFNNSPNSTINITEVVINSKNQGIYNYAANNTWNITTADLTSRQSHGLDFATISGTRSTLKIDAGTYNGALHGAVVHNTNATINGGTYSTTSTNRDHYVFHVESNASLTINDGDVELNAPNASGIYANEAVTITGTSVNSGSTNGYGIYHNSGNLNITNCEITGNNGIESTSNSNYTINYTNSDITATNVGIYMSGTGTKTLNINSGNISGDVMGLYLKGNNTTTNLGVKTNPLSIENPHIISDNLTVNNLFGTLNFYSGLLTGQKVLSSEPNELRDDKEVYYDYTINDGEIATLTSFNHSSSATSNYAKEGNGYARLTFLEYDDSLSSVTNDEPEIVEEIGCTTEVGTVYDFTYTGATQEFIPPCSGQYKLEVWGARGGQGADSNVSNTGWNYGKGGYSVGTITVSDSDVLYVNAGGHGIGMNGESVTRNAIVYGGFNGGGNTYHDGGEFGGSGGGASDIRVNSNSLYARVIVAGGGGGSGEDNESAGHGGGTSSVNGYSSNFNATQTSAGSNGSFGKGANYQNSSESGGGGGGGWYGGGGGAGGGSGGGSGYVYTPETAQYCPNGCLLNQNYFLTNAQTIAGNQSFKSPSGANETGHADNGFARITFVAVDNELISNSEVILELDPREGSMSNTTIYYVPGDSLGILPDPTPFDNHIFEGWFTDLSYSRKVTENTKINYNTKLYAKYTNNNDIICESYINHVYAFDYINSTEMFEAYCPGKYKVEVWGASGGVYSPNTKYGYGGYSTGEITLNRHEQLYITVGGQGSSDCSGGYCKGGFNGGGYGLLQEQTGSGGGGATHIAKTNGLLSELSNKRDSIIIVAGGGGGSGQAGIGGSGGGFKGADGLDTYNNAGYTAYNGTGASENAGGKTYNSSVCLTGSFGKGANICIEGYGGSGGGAGYFGGGGSNRGHGGAGGGSGYINETLVTKGQMSGFNIPSKGHGIVNAYLSTKQGFLEVNDTVYSSFELAIDALDEEGGTIKVLNHASIKENVIFPADKNIVLDMNGFELTFIKPMVNESTLTIKNEQNSKSTITNVTSDVINNKGIITVNNVAIVSGASGICIKGTTGNGEIKVINNSSLSGGNGIITDVKQNITYTNSNINVGSYGIKVNQGTGEIEVSNSNIKSNNIGIELNSANNTLDISHVSFDTSGTSVNIPGTNNIVDITNDTFKSSGTAINVGGNSNTITIDQVNINASTGLNVTGGSEKLTITNNTINTTSTGINMTGAGIISTITNNNLVTSGTSLSSTGNNCNSTIDTLTITSNGAGINHRGSSNSMTIDNLVINSRTTGIYHTGNSSVLTVTNGEIVSTTGNGILDDSTTNTDTRANLVLTDTNVTGATYGVNIMYCDSTITNCEITTTSKNKDEFAFNSSDWTISTITDSFLNAPNASAARTNSNYIFNNSRLYAGNENGYGLYGRHTNVKLNDTIIETPGINSYGIFLSNDSVNMSSVIMDGGSITSGYIGVGLNNSYSNTQRDFKIIDGTIKGETYGIYQPQNYIVTIGQENIEVDIHNPLIVGGLYGLYKTSGNTSFYSGRLKGASKAYNGTINTIKEGYEIFEDREELTEYELGIRSYNTSQYSADAISKMAKAGNGYAKITYNQYENAQTTTSNYEIVNSINQMNPIVLDYEYTGSYQEFIAPIKGNYKFELWGAQGGTSMDEGSLERSSSKPGGLGGYTEGTVVLEKGEKVYIYVGGVGGNAVERGDSIGGYNGGGNGTWDHDDNEAAGAGGGATDIRLVSGEWNNTTSLRSRIMVAAGGGGAAYNQAGGYAGGLQGQKAYYGSVADQTSGNAFGVGGNGIHINSNVEVAGGGGGYYGGIAKSSGSTNTYKAAGGGGSSFVSGHQGCNAIDESGSHTGQADHYSGMVFSNTAIIDGNGYNWTNVAERYVGQPQPNGSLKTGHSGNGYARITLLDTQENQYANIEYNYGYTGNVETFIPDSDGIYKIEAWGAQGGDYDETNHGGYGGYSVGKIYLTTNDRLYINVGGAGIEGCTTKDCPGGYNGGGSGAGSDNVVSTSGGGATHIATESGLLSTFNNKRDKIVIVAGGGGGTSFQYGYTGVGGSGGGIQGTTGTYTDSNWPSGTGGTQDSGGIGGKRLAGDSVERGRNGSFGEGGMGVNYSGGGGAGYYGGGASNQSGAGGGSGYIGNTDLTDKIMYCYNCQQSTDVNTYTVSTTCSNSDPLSNCAKRGDGFVRITKINSNNSNMEYRYSYTGTEQEFIAPRSGYYDIETWAAQGGGNSDYPGGYGGYSSGRIYLSSGTKLYINVGGQGTLATCTNGIESSAAGGYNGGGSSRVVYENDGTIRYGGSGGGATHIALDSGLLSSLSSHANDNRIIIVSGGGGGFAAYSDGNTTTENYVGSGGGYQGAEGGGAYGATQSSAGYSKYESTRGKGSFGKGGSASLTDTYILGGAGGGGYYGGGAADTGGSSSGSGGSGYIANSDLINKSMYCYNCSENLTNTETFTVSTNGTSAYRNTTSCPSGHSSDPVSKCAKEGNGYVIIKYNELEEADLPKYDFNYTGSEQEFIIPVTGKYKIEVWGAAGGNYDATDGNGYSSHLKGGYGGYSTGEISLSANQKLYINVGGQGENLVANSSNYHQYGVSGGYNGGGQGGNGMSYKFPGGSGGGGATHLALNSGLLSSFNNNKSDVLIVAGGGGGAGWVSAGGSGGGFKGNSTTGVRVSVGGTQLNGYAFGTGSPGYVGASPSGASEGSSGSGAGWYGGQTFSTYNVTEQSTGGAGGSGYVGSTLLSNKYMACYNCETSDDITTKTITISSYDEQPTADTAKQGNGFARLTLLSSDLVTVSFNTDYGTLSDDVRTYNRGDALGELPIPELDPTSDYRFVGWFVDKNYTKKVTESTIVNTTTILYAKFVFTNDYCANITQTVYEFDYTGKEQRFDVLCSGTYTVEVWGAQGGYGIQDGNINAGAPGYGGYSVANIELDTSETLYINVGGKGANGSLSVCPAGGYNGGGSGSNDGGGCSNPSDDDAAGAGGGATHIALESGLLSSLSNKRDKVLIVAGGGGGAAYNRVAGSGGGYIGGTVNASTSVAATQTSGYAFGQGKNGSGARQGSGSCNSDSTSCEGVGGGGGGWYGGLTQDRNSLSSGAGGSGYIGNSRLSDQAMYGYGIRTVYDSADLTVAYLVPALDKIYNVEQNKNYNNIQDAFNEVQDGETLQLTRISSISYDVTIPNKTVTLDLNGHNLITNKSFNNLGILTIIDSTNTIGVSLSSSISNTLINNSNRVIINGITISGYDIINSGEEAQVELNNAKISGHDIIKSTTDGSVYITDCTLSGNNVIATGLRTVVTISNSSITSTSQAVNTAGTLNISNSNIIGNTYGVYTNTASNVSISNTSINATTAVYNNGTGVVTVTDDCNITGTVNNANGNGTLNITGGTLKGPFSNSGLSTISDIDITYSYSSGGDYSFVNNSGTLTLGGNEVRITNSTTSTGGQDRIIYNTGTITSTSNEYVYNSTTYNSRTVNGIENRGILHSTNDIITLSNRSNLYGVENYSSNSCEVTNATITISNTHEALAYYNPGSGTMNVTGGSVISNGEYAEGAYIEGFGEIILNNVAYTLTGTSVTRIGYSNGGTIILRNANATLIGPTSYCLTGKGNLNINNSSCSITSSTNAYGIQLTSGSTTISNTNISISASGTAYGVKMDTGTTIVESGSIVLNAATAYGVHMTNGTTIIGIFDGSGTEQADMNVDNPHIEAVGTTTGVGMTMGNGTFNYYDGKIIGSTRARAQGDITSAVEKNYQVVTRTDEITGYQYCILEFIM